MKIYSLPDELAFPSPDYKNYNFAAERKREEEHQAKIKKHFQDQGYNGPNTGRILSESHADGAANYMFIEGNRKSFLVHLPYGDAWHNPNVRFLPKTEVLKRIRQREAIEELFAKKKAS